MSIVHSSLFSPLIQERLSSARKRTSSFSYPIAVLSPNPRPAKAPRTQMGSLRRTETLVLLPESNATSNSANNTATNTNPLRTLQYHKEQRVRRKGLVNRATAEPLTIRTRPNDISSQPGSRQCPQQQRQSSAPQSISTAKASFTTTKRVSPPKAPSQVILPSIASPITITRTHRTSSPLSPARTVLPGRPIFPRSKPEPDLYRVAIKTHMRSTPEGQKILHMGPRLALSIISATKELERIVADQEQDRDNDVLMSDSTFNLSTSTLASPVLTKSWVFVKNEVHDWEMLDCSV